jgi:uroporphyrinogen decarboxylase
LQNLLTDYYLEPDYVHRLHRALCDLYCGYIERSIRELRPDGFWTSDDLGHQTQLFVRPELFREFIKPYYSLRDNAWREAARYGNRLQTHRRVT